MGAGDIEVAIGENQALFKLSDPAGDVWVASRLIEGQFPNYKQLLAGHVRPRGHARPKDELMAAARRVSLLAQKNAPLRLSFAENRLTMKALTQDVGQAEEALDVEFAGEPFEIGFNPALSHRGHRRDRRRRRAAALHQPAATRAHQRLRRRLHVPHHADPPEQLIRRRSSRHGRRRHGRCGSGVSQARRRGGHRRARQGHGAGRRGHA